MAKQSHSTLKLCVSHCDYGQQVDIHVDPPIAAIASQLPLLIRPVEPRLPAVAENAAVPVALATPPPQLLFSRFLI
jgi:hypothetical protein